MGKVTVYYFTFFDPDKGERVRPRRPGTLAAIHNLRMASSKPLMRTAIEVDESTLDEQGFYARGSLRTLAAGGIAPGAADRQPPQTRPTAPCCVVTQVSGRLDIAAHWSVHGAQSLGMAAADPL